LFTLRPASSVAPLAVRSAATAGPTVAETSLIVCFCASVMISASDHASAAPST
jgi:hypothetical protein